MRRNLVHMEMWGVGFVVVAGVLLHFVYDWVGGSPWVIPFVPVNESVWEHQKLLFWPLGAWGLIQWRLLRLKPCHVVAAKFSASLVAIAAVLLLHYGYRLVTGDHVLWLDIALFVVAAALGQGVSYHVLQRRSVAPPLAALFTVGTVLLIGMFFVLSWYPPHLHPFLDEPTNTYGPRPVQEQSLRPLPQPYLPQSIRPGQAGLLIPTV